jgi:hypothetical protein
MFGIRKLDFLTLGLVTAILLLGCNEVFKTKYDGQKGDIVWVGNGLKLEKNHGVIIDVFDSVLGPQSLLLSQDRLLPLVREVSSGEKVAVRFDWASANLGSAGPALQMQVLSQEPECSRFLLSKNNLICHEILESLEMKPGSIPIALNEHRILYLDLFDTLHYFDTRNEKKRDSVVVGQVAHYLDVANRFVFVRHQAPLPWSCWQVGETDEDLRPCDHGIIEGFEHIVRLSNESVMGLNFSNRNRERGVYRISAQGQSLAIEKKSDIPEDWIFMMLGESEDLIRIGLSDQKDRWIRVTAEGLEWIQLRSRPDADGLKLNEQRDFFLSRVDGEVFELCETGADGLVSIARCQALMRSDDFVFTEMVLYRDEENSSTKLLAVSESKGLSINESRPPLVSTYEVRRGLLGGFYFVALWEFEIQSQILGIKTYDLRISKTDNQD